MRTGFFGDPPTATFRLPDGDSSWTLVVRGRAGTDRFVSLRRPLFP